MIIYYNNTESSEATGAGMLFKPHSKTNGSKSCNKSDQNDRCRSDQQHSSCLKHPKEVHSQLFADLNTVHYI